MKRPNAPLLSTVLLLLSSTATVACEETPSTVERESGTSPTFQVNVTADEYCSLWAQKHRAEVCDEPDSATERQTAEPALEDGEQPGKPPTSAALPSATPPAERPAQTPTAAPHPPVAKQRRINTGL